MEQKIDQLAAKLKGNSAFAEKLFSLDEPADVYNLLKEHGLEFSREEIQYLGEEINQAFTKSQPGELSDEALEEVAGGNVYRPLLELIKPPTSPGPYAPRPVKIPLLW